MNNLIKLIILFTLLSVAGLTHAQDNLTKQQKKELKQQKKLEKLRLKQEKEIEDAYFVEQQKLNKVGPITENDVVYIFGVGTNFNDSTVYLTRITTIDSLRIDKKTGFLPNRVEFSLQMKQYLEGTLGLMNETTCIFFSDKRKKIAKYFYKLKKRYFDEGYKNMIVIDPKDFNFVRPAFINTAK